MGQLHLEGATLGERHQYYNKLLKEAIAEKSSSRGIINIDENDVDNLIKIDVACSNRNVEYILEVLKSEDLLYVSRAIKRSTWLITDPQYAHIVNPEYLHTQLFPQMTAKASSMLLSQIRLHLKDEVRVDDFYNHIKQQSVKLALKWLPHCSVALIEQEVGNPTIKLDTYLIKRLSARSFTVVEILLKHCEYYHGDVFKATMFLLKPHTEKYFGLFEDLVSYKWPDFGAKSTDIIMKKCPEKIIDNFEEYHTHIDVETFAKHLKNTDIKGFLLKYLKKERMKYWFQFDNLKHFIRYIPSDGRFEFLKKVFIEKSVKNIEESGDRSLNDCDFIGSVYTRKKCYPSASLAHIYMWYRFAPFEVAFPDLKKLIRNESSPKERSIILEILLSCAGCNLDHVHTLLQFYQDKHINEPFKFKIQFINMVISKTDIHMYDEKTWNILNTIFYSLEVYIESENNVQMCVQSIIQYNVLHGEKIPDIIEKKFVFNTMKSVQKKLNKDEQSKLFNYLYNILVTKIDSKIVQNESEFAEVVELLESIFELVLDWKRNLSDYPWIINKIREMIIMKKEKSFTTDLSRLYNKNKSWRKQMFEESLVLNPSEKTCINALKHDPELLTRYRDEVEALCQNNNISLKQLLGKLRIYWPESMASEWANWYLKRLDTSGGHSALVRGICVLLPQKPLLDVVKKYAPVDTKINWTEDDEHLLSLRKHIAKNMYLARPLPPTEIVLLYGQGDYLQYALPSLNAVLYNMRPIDSRQNLEKFLDAPVSLQKHGIRLAVSKVKSQMLKQILNDIWKSTKNSTIRAVLFQQTYKLLCKEKNPVIVEEIWDLFKNLIENLSQEENRIIYIVLGQVETVPPAVKGRFCMKAYEFLKSLPTKATAEAIIKKLLFNMSAMMEHLDDDFVARVLLESLETFAIKNYEEADILASYLLCTDNVETQTHRYEKVLAPLLDKGADHWNKTVNGNYAYFYNLKYLLKLLRQYIPTYTFAKNMIFPVKLYTDILNKLEETLPLQNNYDLLRNWKLSMLYIEQLEEHRADIKAISIDPNGKNRERCGIPHFRPNRIWNEYYLKAAPGFAASCADLLENEIKSHFSSAHVIFSKALENMFIIMDIEFSIRFDILKAMLEYKDFTECYLMVLHTLPINVYEEELEGPKLKELQKMIMAHPSDEVKMHFYSKFEMCELPIDNTEPLIN